MRKRKISEIIGNINQKYVDEAAAYTGIGMNKLRELSDDDSCDFVLWIGRKRLLKRKKLEEFLENSFSL